MTVYTQCDKCNEWTVEREMDYFTGIGSVCGVCAGKLLNESEGEGVR